MKKIIIKQFNNLLAVFIFRHPKWHNIINEMFK